MHIKVENISQTLGNNPILKDVSLECKDGQFVGILGPNGSGKSTLLHCIYRTAKPKKGIIYFDGENINHMGFKDTAKKISVVAQHNSYQFDFSVIEAVMMGRSPHKKMLEQDNRNDLEIAENSLKQVGLTGMENRTFSTLSGGEQQRVILARALTQQTPCIILDEPTNHLDIRYQLEMLSLIKNMKITVIAAIHDLNIASLYCDYIYILKNGNIYAHGKPDDIITPATIKEVYGVESKIYRDSENGKTHILYQP